MDDIKHLWIIAREAGVCIFEASFGELKKEIDGDLIAGFFSAMLQFAQEISASDVKSIKLGDADLLFSLSDYVVCVLWVDDVSLINPGAKVLTELEGKFYSRYRPVFEANWGGNVTVFEDFANDVEQVTSQKPLDKMSTKFLGKPFLIQNIRQKIEARKDQVKEFIANQKGQIKDLLEKSKIFQKIVTKLPKSGSLGKKKESS